MKTRPFSLLATKLFVPKPPPQLLSRPRLLERLNEGLRSKVLLLSAPAGFGKTMLLGDWVRREEIPTAWFSIDAGDRDPAHFLTYIIAALQKIEEGIGRTALNLLQSPQVPPMESVLITLINSIAPHKDDFVLVLDDLHSADSPDIIKPLAFFIENMPPQMHLFISTRSDPPLHLARLRGRNQLAEIRASDLSFTTEETASFFQRCLQIRLADEDLNILEARTEGWIAGLQLAALSLKDRKDASEFIRFFAGDNRFIVDYLGEEVLNRLTEQEQLFLQYTSILERISVPLCNALTGKRDGSDMLDFLEKSNLFIFPLDNERRWFRYHNLFLDLLRKRLKSGSPELWSELHRRASIWFEEQGYMDEAIEYSLSAEDMERASDLILARSDSIWDRGQQHRLLDWLGRLPDSAIQARPRLNIYIARALAISGRLREAGTKLDEIRRILEEKQKNSASNSFQVKDLLGRTAAIQAFLAAYQGDSDGMINFSRSALDQLDGDNIMWRGAAASTLGMAHSWAGDGDVFRAETAFKEAVRLAEAAGSIYFYLFSGNALATAESLKGNLNKALDILSDLLSAADKTGAAETGMAGAVLAVKGSLMTEMEDPEAGLLSIEDAIRITRRARDSMGFLGCLVNKIQALLILDRFTETQKVLNELVREVKRFPAPPWMRQMMESYQGRIWLGVGNLAALPGWIKKNNLDAKDEITFRRETLYLVLARYLITQKEFRQADRLLRRLIDFSLGRGRCLFVMTYRFHLSLLLMSLDDPGAALGELRHALPTAEKGGIYRSMRTFGREMGILLEKLLEDDKIHPRSRGDYTSGYVKRLRVLFHLNAPFIRSDVLLEPLSEREKDVLQLIAAGLTNQEIADKLFISLNTVRTHTKNINAKLGVHNRTQAAARAKELSLL